MPGVNPVHLTVTINDGDLNLIQGAERQAG